MINDLRLKLNLIINTLQAEQLIKSYSFICSLAENNREEPGAPVFDLVFSNDNMSPVYLKGDTVIFNEVLPFENNKDYALLMADKTITFKRVNKHKNITTTRCLNPKSNMKAYDEIAPIDFKILGRTTKLSRYII